MTKKDFLYALENEGLIDCVRDENNKIDVAETIKSDVFRRGCRMPSGERLDLRTIFRILEDEGAFTD